MAGAFGHSAATTHVRGRIGSYRIVEQIGEGGMGVVYLAQDDALGRSVALKLLAPALSNDPQFRDRFVRESRLAAAIDHPNIIPVYEAGDADGQLFIAMRYVRGIDLRRLLAAEAPLDPNRAIELVDQVARALDAAHRDQLVHRDVKPANVMIDQSEGREHCYLTDFGLTKSVVASSGFTATGGLVGTLNYMAPEQIEGRRVDGRADIYALGCVLFECLAGVIPFPRDTEVAMMYAHLHDPPPSLCASRPDLPSSVDAVLARAMAKAPADRHATCCDVIAELRAALAGVPIMPFEPSFASTGPRFSRPSPAPPTAPAAPPPRGRPTVDLTPPPTRPRRSSPRFALIAAAALLLLAGGALAAVELTKTDEPSLTAQQQAQQRLLRRTVLLQRDLMQLRTKLINSRGVVNDATKRRIAADQAAAKALVAGAHRQRADARTFADAVGKAGKEMAAAAGAMRQFAKTHDRAQIPTINIHVSNAGGHVTDAGNDAPGPVTVPSLPPVPTGPQITGAAAPSAPKLQLPDDALATIKAAPGSSISAVTTVGDVDGDGKPDVGVVTDDGVFVLFAGKGKDVTLDDGLTPDRGFEIPGATAVAPAGDANGDGKDDLSVTGPDDSRLLVFAPKDPSIPIDLSALGPDQGIDLGSTTATVVRAGRFDGGTSDDLLVADGDQVMVEFGPDPSPDRAVTISGDSFTSAAPAGDVNGDGTDDVIASTDQDSYVIYGSDSPADLDVSKLTPDQGFKISGAEAVPAGDVGGDGADDLVLTSPGAGTAQVLFGSKNGPLPDVSADQIDSTQGFTIDGVSGSGAKAGDLDARSPGDLIFSTDSGAEVVYGGDGGRRTLAVVASGGPTQVAGGVDFDGDGQPDVLVGDRDSAYVVSPK